MTNINHERLAARVRVTKSERLERERLSENFQWLTIKFGPYRGKNLPELMFTSLSYFYRTYEEGKFWGELGHQAKIIADRARHIRPPKKRPDKWEFGILLGPKNQLKKISLLRKCKPSKSGKLIRLPHLDLSIVRRFEGCDTQAGDRLIDFLKTEYFGGENGRLFPGYCEVFFSDDKNFELTCRAPHGLPE